MNYCLVLILFVTGCTHISVSSSFIDDNGRPRTEKLHAVSFFAKNNLDKIDVLSKTKTTSKVLGAKGLDSSVDSEGIQAANNVIKSIVEGAVIGATKAVKP